MAVDMFLDVKDVKGESKDKKYKDKIDVLAWSWGVSNSGTMHQGGGGGAGKANVQDLSITKYVDRSSAVLQLSCMKGTHYDTVNLICRKAGGTSPVEYITINLKGVIITSVSTGGSGGEDRLTENVTFNFKEVAYKYQEQDPKGAALGDPADYSWDISANADA